MIAEFGYDYYPDSLHYYFNSTGEECANVSLLSDKALEGPHSFSASLDSASPGVSLDSENLTITIIDTNSMSTTNCSIVQLIGNYKLCLPFAAVIVAFEERDGEVTEGDMVEVCITIDDISPFGGLEVDVTVPISGEGLDDITGKHCPILLSTSYHVISLYRQ